MAIVILSARAVTRGDTRTISLRAFAGLVVAGMLLVLALGFALGMALVPEQVSESARDPDLAALVVNPATGPVAQDSAGFQVGPATAVPEAPEVVADTTDNRMLIDRFGELSGRMIRLESEARVLAERISVIRDFEERVSGSDEAGEARGRLARTPPGSSGGPWLAPREEFTPAPSLSAIELDLDGDLQVQLEQMDADVSALATRLSELDQIATSFKLAHLSFPGRSPMPDVSANSNFGNRIDPFNRRRAFHSGVDFNAPRGTPILASAGGRVIFSGRRAQYGLTVEIEHMAGLVTRYAHASKLHVAVGEVVMPGALIAEVGSTGRSTGPHLHFEILKDGYFVNPSIYLAHF